MNRRLRVASEAGQTVALVALLMPILLGMAGFAVDIGMWYAQRQEVQGAADFGSLAAAAELPGSPTDASTAGKAQVDKNISNASTVVTAPYNSEPGQARVRVEVNQPTYFAKLLGIDTVKIGATAVAETATVTSLTMSSLPIGMLKDQYKVTYPPTNTPLGDGGLNKNGIIYPKADPPLCTPISGGNDVSKVIASGAYGGVDACPMEPGEDLVTKKGWTAGDIKKGFDDRIGTNTQSFDEVFEWDAGAQRYTILDPKSPRIGVTPIVTTTDGTSEWGDKTMKIAGYVLCYIGDTRKSPSFPAHDNGKTVWISPVAAVLPEDWQASTGVAPAVDGSPVVYRLVD